jgi:hypothetical protein
MSTSALKTNLFLLHVLLLTLLNSNSYSQTKDDSPKVNPINGIWADSNSAAFSNGYAIFSVDGHGKLVVTHYVEFNGVPMVEKGIGFCHENTISYDVFVTKAIPGWSTTGQHVLSVSADGNTLRGHYIDSKGNKGPLVFKRLYK